MTFLYQIFIHIYHLLIQIASFFNEKARLWVNGRQQQVEPINAFQRQSGKKVYWMHCASLGEFEQGRPLIEKLKAERNDLQIVLTFYSPSGYEIRKNYALADAIFYLPVDTQRNAKWFLDKINPDVAIFVKYEFWYNYLNELKKNGVKALLISAIFRENQVFFKPYGGFFRKMLTCFHAIFVQDETSNILLKNIGIESIIAGDTRVDRVLDIASKVQKIEAITAFVGDKKVFICGSTWQPDEAILIPFFEKKLNSDWKIIIAPHEIDENHIAHLMNNIGKNVVRYTDWINEDFEKKEYKILIINNIGLLNTLYQYGTIAYIGGGLGKGIHNTLEPIAFGLPVLFGPKYQKFQEANWLVENQGAFVVQNQEDLHTIFDVLNAEDYYKSASHQAENYVGKFKGATHKIMEYGL